jgi:hypothetical protein
MYRQSSSNNAGAEAAAAEQDSSMLDADLLAFGGCASMNADLKRAIIKEIEEIDGSISKMKKEKGVGDAVAAELDKGGKHAEKESRTLLHRSAQTVEALKLSQEFSHGLQSTISTEIPFESNPQEAEEAASSETQQGSVKSLQSIREGQLANEDTFKMYLAEIKETTNRVRELNASKNEILADCSTKLGDEYEQRLANVQANVSSSSQVLQNEKDRTSALKTTHEKEGQKNLELDKEIAKLVRTTRLSSLLFLS